MDRSSKKSLTSNPALSTLIDDINNILVEGVEDTEETNEKLDAFGKAVASVIKEKLLKENKQKGFTLRMSNIGSPCVRKLYLEKNHPENKEELTPDNLLKFLFGDLTEELLIFLADISGHKVEGRQDEVEIEGIKGHRDVIIDGTLMDVKSASSYSFKKFKEGLTPETDAFGYLTQIKSYHAASQDDPLVTDKEHVAFLVFDKQHGHICLDIHSVNPPKDWNEFYKTRKEIVDGKSLPERGFQSEPFGKSGNMKLGVNCSYCNMKDKCWPGLRKFIYSTGPVFLTEVKYQPNVPEET